MASGFLDEECTFSVYTQEHIDSCSSFDCDNKDLNNFFSKDSPLYNTALLGKTYCFILDNDPKTVVCAFTIANDSIQATLLPGSRKKKIIHYIPWQKHMRNYPAVLIGRLGVNKNFQGKGLGNELMDFIKSWFIDGNNKTGCRFVVVDSYNKERPLKYYRDNGFDFVFGSESQEKEYLSINSDVPLKTRLMFFDLIFLKNK